MDDLVVDVYAGLAEVTNEGDQPHIVAWVGDVLILPHDQEFGQHLLLFFRQLVEDKRTLCVEDVLPDVGQSVLGVALSHLDVDEREGMKDIGLRVYHRQLFYADVVFWIAALVECNHRVQIDSLSTIFSISLTIHIS